MALFPKENLVSKKQIRHTWIKELEAAGVHKDEKGIPIRQLNCQEIRSLKVMQEVRQEGRELQNDLR